MSKKLVIFDMDGTLIDSSLTIVNAINFVRNNLGLKPMEEKLILGSINDPKINPAKFYYDAESFTPKHEEWFSDYYSLNHEKEIRFYDGIDNLLTTLKLDGYRLAVATNAYRVSAIESLKHLDIYEKFDVIACADDVPLAKPHPEMLYKILDELKLTRDEAIFVGDGERDLLASQNAKIDYLMVNWGFSDYSDAIHSVERLQESILEF
ncbi:HAD family hydrolase [Sulfurovum sp. bin170]|uniref:HAD family hydrolase n=1 Tax=Sulfurovum sp. bin170 TaxID=2695268 RepID=UPI0013DF7767|nr:HAD family hydrolase [Sulfurovum sp. bin170]NEW61201.1 HAD family hydrolase [Sulfurovum sp. bin170]